MYRQKNVACKQNMKYYPALKNEGNSAICNNMDESWGNYTECNKPITEKLHNSTYFFTFFIFLFHLYDVSKIVKVIKGAKKKMVFTRWYEEGKKGNCSMSMKFQFVQDRTNSRALLYNTVQ